MRSLAWYQLREEIEDFLYLEADLLDQRRFKEWLDLLAEDLVYFMPMRRNVKFGQHAEKENTRRAAEAELQAAVKLDPKNGEYRVMLAELYRDLGLKLRARGEAERALAADPNNRQARDLLRALKSV